MQPLISVHIPVQEYNTLTGYNILITFTQDGAFKTEINPLISLKKNCELLLFAFNSSELYKDMKII